jgi:hypothetical protein
MTIVDIVTYRPIDRQRRGKHAFLTVEAVFYVVRAKWLLAAGKTWGEIK